MPMNAPLNLLRTGLERFATGLQARLVIPDPTPMVRARQQVEKEHGSAGIRVDTQTILSVVENFRQTRTVQTYKELKYVCLGVGSVDPKGWCVVADAPLFDQVTHLVLALAEMRRRIRCFQAMLSSYWTFPLNDKHTSSTAKGGWDVLRRWLRSEHQHILQSKEQKPPWFAALTKHIALLSEQPCEQFGEGLLRGDSSGLREAMENLAIPSDSWVLEEAVIAQIRAGCALNDDPFKEKLSNLINIGSGRGDVDLGESLKLRSVALLVSRYAKCREHPEDIALRDAAVNIVGNPWLHPVNWDAWVVDDRGKPDEKSRKMVNGWLKRRLITDFFELLSVDGTGDSRRVDYWLRFEPAIEDMWFALGTDAQYRSGEQFNDFRNRAKGRLLDLDGTTTDNNAFVMRVGRYLLVEFGAKGNAMYVFEWEALGQPLLETLSSGRVRASVSIHQLKDRNYVERLIHRDTAAQRWEKKFDAELVPLIGKRPSAPPRRTGQVRSVQTAKFTEATWSDFARKHSLQVTDNRSKQGALWVHGVEQSSHVIAQLEAWGFKQRIPRGWYKE